MLEIKTLFELFLLNEFSKIRIINSISHKNIFYIMAGNIIAFYKPLYNKIKDFNKFVDYVIEKEKTEYEKHVYKEFISKHLVNYTFKEIGECCICSKTHKLYTCENRCSFNICKHCINKMIAKNYEVLFIENQLVPSPIQFLLCPGCKSSLYKLKK